MLHRSGLFLFSDAARISPPLVLRRISDSLVETERVGQRCTRLFNHYRHSAAFRARSIFLHIKCLRKRALEGSEGHGYCHQTTFSCDSNAGGLSQLVFLFWSELSLIVSMLTERTKLLKASSSEEQAMAQGFSTRLDYIVPSTLSCSPRGGTERNSLGVTAPRLIMEPSSRQTQQKPHFRIDQTVNLTPLALTKYNLSSPHFLKSSG